MDGQKENQIKKHREKSYLNIEYGRSETVSDIAAVSYEAAWEDLILWLRRKGYAVLVLMREARGNAGDVPWRKQYTMVGDGGVFKKLVEKLCEESRRPSFEEAPEIRHIAELDERELSDWCGCFDLGCGENTVRKLWITDPRNKAYKLSVYKMPKPRLNHDRITRGPFRSRLKEEYRYFLSCVFAGEPAYDGPEPPPVPKEEPVIDLSACEALFDLRLGDLKSGEEFKGADILLLDEEKIRQCAIQFFSEGTIRNRAGHRPTSEEKYRFMCRMIEFGQHWRRNEFANHRKDVTCSPGWFSHCYMEREEHCYDGGSGGTDTVTRELIFSRVTKSRGELEAKLKEELTVWLRRWKEADKVIRQCKESWLYDGTLTDETIPVLLCGGRLYLMDPFGMQGIFCFTRGGRG